MIDDCPPKNVDDQTLKMAREPPHRTQKDIFKLKYLLLIVDIDISSAGPYTFISP
jgi:hypothetical protein